MTQTLDVTRQVDRQPVGSLLCGLLALCLLVTLADGYNISVTSFAGPALIKTWHLNRAALGPLLSSSLIAGLVGPFLFGVLADRVGRRNAMIASTLMIGGFGIVSGFCDSLTSMVAVRFIAGIGMSGALAVTVATINEFAPRRVRATFVTIVFSGTTIGSGLPGLVAPTLLANYGWPSLFFLGGSIPLVLAIALYAFMPESPKFLSLRPSRHAELAKLLQRADPALRVEPDATFTLGEDSKEGASLSPTRLFVGKLAILTPLLWFGAFVAMIVFHSFNTWLPTLLPDAGLTDKQASYTVAMFQFVGTLGGWVIMRPLDRFGMVPCTALYVLSLPLVACLAWYSGSPSTLMLLVPIAGFCILGLHFAQVSCVSSVYPTAIRATGVGWFVLIARVGGAVGPLIVGALTAQHVSLKNLFYLATLPLGVGAVASVAVTLIYNAHYHRVGADSAPLPAGPVAADRTA
ncbi:MAG TPA: MFS transporter [Steroidobacteraceae bacterium]|jgi:AAHS family 4-hydroxybenzoate transporter-like MFS transporter